MTIHKWGIRFQGKKTYLAPDYKTALKMATDDLAVTPKSFEFEAFRPMDLGPVKASSKKIIEVWSEEE